MSQREIDGLLHAATAPEYRMPDHKATKVNSLWLLAGCVLTLVSTPVMIAWLASSLLR